MAGPDTPDASADAKRPIVDAFLRARRAGEALAEFPGTIPETLVDAYGVQDSAIAEWGDELVGWKVGYIAPERRDSSGDDRLLGPVFRRNLQQVGDDLRIAVFAGGFGAIEAEYVLRLDADAPADKTEWTPEEAAALPATLFVGLEVASSPLATINQLGPLVVVSDFGNNNGLVVGAEIPQWTRLDDAALRVESRIDDVVVGTGGATTLPGGLRQAFAFALSRSARRGRPLKRGELIATGNATGIHDILPGQRARLVFEGHGEIVATVEAAGAAGTGAA
ncbi:2-keto-4-pentenoate hydratase [Luteimonas chenhongjianii]|uniref:2-keto-4-pentenoate hydratase n=1 Tax=Luteimonas chenhongjianii TaxID=2006110 RepID=UPI001FE46D2E|nr:2-keto-4-pentenoate hydratase [Luteimonas chenhongjianii]